MGKSGGWVNQSHLSLPGKGFLSTYYIFLALMWEPSGGRRSSHPQGPGSWALKEASSQAGDLWRLDRRSGWGGREVEENA